MNSEQKVTPENFDYYWDFKTVQQCRKMLLELQAKVEVMSCDVPEEVYDALRVLAEQLVELRNIVHEHNYEEA